MPERPDVPNPVKRLLRQEAGFGCCKCGRPIYEYHHIIPYADDHHFRPNDMMVLCPYCHTEVEYGLLDEDEQRRCKANPYNIVHGLAQGPLALQQRTLAIALGSNQFVGDGTFIRVDNHPLLSLSLSADGRLQISVELNDRDGNLLALIDKNEWITGDPHPWDVEYGGRWLIIRRQQGEVSLHVDARPNVVSVRGSLWYKRQRFVINEAGIRFNDTALQAGQSGQRNIGGVGLANLCVVGAGLVATTDSPNLQIVPDARFGRYMLVSWPDIDERLRRGFEAWERLTILSRAPVVNLLPHKPTSQMPLPHKRRKS